jgi:transposase
VIRAKQLLFVAAEHSYTEVAHLSGVKSGDTTSSLVSRLNQEGLNALQAHRGGGPKDKYGTGERAQILKEFRHAPQPETDATTTRSLKTLCAALLTRGRRGYNPHGFT